MSVHATNTGEHMKYTSTYSLSRSLYLLGKQCNAHLIRKSRSRPVKEAESHAPCHESKPGFSSPWSAHYTDWANPASTWNGKTLSNLVSQNREEWDGLGMWHVWVRRGEYIGSWWGNRREGFHWGDLDIDGWILEWICRRWDVGIWTGLSWPRIETGGGSLWVR